MLQWDVNDPNEPPCPQLLINERRAEAFKIAGIACDDPDNKIVKDYLENARP
jgi:hypothetical protein